MPDLTRRRALQACAAVGSLGIAGCASRRSTGKDPTTEVDSGTTTTGATTTTGPPTLALGETATVGNAAGRDESGEVGVKTVEGRRQYFLGRLAGGGQRAVRGSRDRTYLWTAFAISWSEASADCFMPGDGFARLVLDGDPHPIAEPCAYESNRSERGDGEAVFGVPADATPDRGRIEWLEDSDRVAAWRLPDETVAWLNDPPAFEVRGVEGPDRIRDGQPGTVTVVVENVGGRDGTFRYGIDSSYTSGLRLGSVTVPAGETVRVERTPTFADSSVTGDPPPGTVRVEWGYGSASVSPTLVAGTTTEGGSA